MEKTLKNLMQMSCVLRNRTMLSNYVAVVQPLQTIRKCYYASASEDLSKSQVLQKSTETKTTTTFAPKDVMGILQMLADNNVNLNVHKAITLILPATRGITKHPTNSLYNHKGFNNLCMMIFKNLNSLSLNEVLNCLKIISYFGLPFNTRLAQSLLQIIRVSINKLSIEQISFLHSIINRHRTTIICEALSLALPVVFHYKMNLELELDDIRQLSISLNYAVKVSNADAISVIVSAIDEFQWNIDSKSAIGIFKSLCYIDHSNMIHRVTKKIQNTLLNCVKEITPKDTMAIIRAMSHKIQIKRYSGVYAELIEAMINNAVANNIDLKTGLQLLSQLNNISCTHISLLDYLAAKFYEDICATKNIDVHQKVIFLQALALADYKPVFWEDVWKVLTEENFQVHDKEALISIALSSAILDSHSNNIIRKVFHMYSYQDSQQTVFIHPQYASAIFLLYQSIKTMHPEYIGPMLSKSVLDICKLNQRQTKHQSPLKATLEQALGGPQYVKHNMETKLGHMIDHVVVMKKGGYPVVINSDTENVDKNDVSETVEDLVQHADSQTILILTFPRNAYLTNSPRLKGSRALMLRTIEAATGFRTISINEESWQNLPESEKIPYLMQAIMLKCDDLS